MADDPTVEGVINESLVRDLDTARKERDDLRALLGRPVTVNIQSADADLMRKLEAHLPKLSQMPEHLAVIAGELVKAAKQREANDAALARRLDQLGDGIVRIADVLERLAPIPADLGDPEER